MIGTSRGHSDTRSLSNNWLFLRVHLICSTSGHGGEDDLFKGFELQQQKQDNYNLNLFIPSYCFDKYLSLLFHKNTVLPSGYKKISIHVLHNVLTTVVILPGITNLVYWKNESEMPLWARNVPSARDEKGHCETRLKFVSRFCIETCTTGDRSYPPCGCHKILNRTNICWICFAVSFNVREKKSRKE